MLDSYTLIIALAATFSLQALLFLLMAFFMKAYQGMRFWAIGCFGLTLNLIALYLRGEGLNEAVSIISSNAFSVTSLFLFYYGTKQIMGLNFNPKWGIVSACVYMLTIAYFTFVENRLNERIVLYSIMMSTIMIMNSILLIRSHHKSFRISAMILAVLFLLIGVFFMVRAVYCIFVPVPDNDFFTNSGIQPITLLVSLCLGILWTEGIILMINQKLLGDLTKKTVELELTNSEKDKFFSILAHDLRGPLSSIMGMVELMADKKSELSLELHQEMAAAMKKSINSTNILVDNLLDWASLQRGLNQIQKVQTTYGELMQSVLPTLQIQADNKKISIDDDIPAATPLVADIKMVQSIFRNLIANAIKFTPANGTILLTSTVDEYGRLVFSVRDSGIGMDQDIQENLFQINPHGRRTGTDGEKSTGLGLMICKEFIEKHGGEIRIDSEAGKGSNFSFCLEPIQRVS